MALYLHAPRSIPSLVLRLAVTFSPALVALVAGWLVDEVTNSEGGAWLPIILAPLLSLSAVLMAGNLAASFGGALGQDVARTIDGQARDRIRAAALLPPTVDHLDDQTFVADMIRASDLTPFQGRLRSLGTAAVGQVQLIIIGVGALASALVLAQHSVLLSVVVLAGTWVTRVITRHQWFAVSAAIDHGLPAKRGVEYWTKLLSGPADAKEVRLFGLGTWLRERRRRADLAWMEPVWDARRHLLRQQWITIGLAGLTAGAALAYIGAAGLTGSLGPGDLVAALSAAFAVASLGRMDYETYDVVHGLAAMQALERLERHAAPAEAPQVSHPLPADRPPHIEFDRVTYRYPGAHRAVVEDLSLDVPAGQVLAVVGRNGAGKTTLIQLLAGLREPVAGQVIIGGQQLGPELSPSEWRRRVSITYQDFLRYGLSVADNIGLGAPEAPRNQESLEMAVERAAAGTVIDRLPARLETSLWRGGRSAVDLSGGQWQKVAIARAMFAVEHGRQVVVLDEPTAHLDVRAEAEFYEQVISAVAGRATVILISHRLSTVRHADRIVFLSGGAIAEDGTHDQLMTRNGEYSELFRLQASRFSFEGLDE